MAQESALARLMRRSPVSIPKLVIFIVAFAFFALPLFLLVESALTANSTISFQAPTQLTLSNFTSVMTSPGFTTSVVNGLILSGGSSAIALVLATIAAYPLSRFRFRGRVGYLLLVLFITGVPVTALIVPLFEFFRSFGWLNSLFPVLLLMAAFATPISIWLVKTFLDNVDPALEESAWIDGASRIKGYVRVVLPLMSTGLLVAFLLSFITGWANFYLPFILLSSTGKLPIAVTIYQFFGSYGNVEYGRLAAFSILYSIPPALLYLFTGGRLGGSFASGAFKG
jgi:multiple sugar transport system permease protein